MPLLCAGVRTLNSHLTGPKCWASDTFTVMKRAVICNARDTSKLCDKRDLASSKSTQEGECAWASCITRLSYTCYPGSAYIYQVRTNTAIREFMNGSTIISMEIMATLVFETFWVYYLITNENISYKYVKYSSYPKRWTVLWKLQIMFNISGYQHWLHSWALFSQTCTSSLQFTS